MAKIAKSILNAARAMLDAGADGTIAEKPGADLLAFYNDNAERFDFKTVKKFADRATATKRVGELAQAIVDAANAPAKQRPAASDADRSAAISATWKDPAVASARAARHGVKVGGTVYRSVHAAFMALGLDLKRHVAFRATLVSEGKAEFDGHKFELATN